MPLGAVAGEDRKPSFGDEEGPGGRGQLPPSCVRGGRTADLTREHPGVRGRGGAGECCLQKAAGFLGVPGQDSLWEPPIHPSHPVAASAPSFPGFKTALPKPVVRGAGAADADPVAKPFLTQRAVRVAGTSGGLWHPTEGTGLAEAYLSELEPTLNI